MQDRRREGTSGGGPDKPGAGPRHALEKPATVHAVSSEDFRALGVAILAHIVISHGALLGGSGGGHFTMSLPLSIAANAPSNRTFPARFVTRFHLSGNPSRNE